MTDSIGIALLGTGFMGRAHANAWRQVNVFFEPRPAARLEVVCGRRAEATEAFARRWGVARAAPRLEDVLGDEGVDLVDVLTPNDLHAEQSIAALEAGRHVACEKPLAGTIDDARRMRDAARRAARRGLRTFVWFNYRRCPAIAFARGLIEQGRLGAIRHVRARYLQDWGRAATPMAWRFDAARAGSGAHGDLNAHSIDLARFLTGDEIIEVAGAVRETFVKRRPRGDGSETDASTVDDCLSFLGRLGGGATASFEASRLATGSKNRNQIEIDGERGAIRFDFERMNELLWWDDALPSAERGWSRILCTNPGDHPWIEAYWPPAHLIGYEHGFISQAADMLRVLGGGKPVVPVADFEDGWRVQQVLRAAELAAERRCRVEVGEVG